MSQKFDWHKFWRAKNPDNSTYKLGIGVYLIIITVFLVCLGIYVHNPEVIRSMMKGQGVNAPRIATAVAKTEKVAQPAPKSELNSERDLQATEASQEQAKAGLVASDKAPATMPRVETRNALDQAVEEANTPVDRERERQKSAPSLPGFVRYDSDGSSEAPTNREPLTQTESSQINIRNFGGGSSDTYGGRSVADTRSDSRGGGGSAVTIDDLMAYRRKSGPAPAGPTAVVPGNTKFSEGKFLPRGFTIALYLLDTIRTDSPQPLIILGVARDAVFRGEVVIPFGTRVLATASGGNPATGTRVVITPSSFQFPDGTELAVSSVIKGSDRVTGLPAYYIPPPTWVQLSSYVNDFLSGYLGLIYSRQQQLSKLQIGSISVGTDTAFDPKLEAINTTSNVIRDFAARQMTELQARNAPYLIVPPGTPCEMDLLAPLTLQDVGFEKAPLAKVAESQSQPFISAPKVELPAGAEKLFETAKTAASTVTNKVSNAISTVGAPATIVP